MAVKQFTIMYKSSKNTAPSDARYWFENQTDAEAHAAQKFYDGKIRDDETIFIMQVVSAVARQPKPVQTLSHDQLYRELQAL